MAVDLIVPVLGCGAEGVGIRGTARVCEVDPHTVLPWLVEVADHLRECSRAFLHALPLTQVPLDALYAWLSALQDGEVSAADAIARLERSPQWVWGAMAPESKRLLAIEGGKRTLAMAQRLVHHLTQVLVPDGAPLFLTDLRRPLPQPEATHGTAKRWQPRTPAMAAGLPDHVWTFREVLLCRVPPWPQPAGV
jgi:hypothetical protein